MNASYWQKGETLDYIPTTDVENSAVIDLDTRVGVAGTAIAAGDHGQIHVVGVFTMDKAAGVTIDMGAALYYDATADVITTTAAGNTPAGYAAGPAAANDGTVLVKLLG